MSLNVTEVADRFEQAYHTLKRLPTKTIQGYRGYWPEIIHDTQDAYGWEKPDLKLGPPTSRHIDEMDKTLRWMLWLEKDEVRIVWMRAARIRWRKIASRMGGLSEKTYQNQYKEALFKVVHRLASPELSNSFPYQKRLERECE